MYESLGLSMTAPRSGLLFGLALGLVFGALAQITRLLPSPRGRRRRGRTSSCGRRLGAGARHCAPRRSGRSRGRLDRASPTTASSLPTCLSWPSSLGGLAFGAGMVLTRGCVSRLTVLLAPGNLRSLTVLLVFAIVAHATLKGVLAPLRTALGSITTPLGEFASLAALPGGAWVWTADPCRGADPLRAAIGRASARPRPRRGDRRFWQPLAGSGRAIVLYDEFDPVALESLSFTSPAAETIFWTVASTAVAGDLRRGPCRRHAHRCLPRGARPSRGCVAELRKPPPDRPLPDRRRADGRGRGSCGRLHRRRGSFRRADAVGRRDPRASFDHRGRRGHGPRPRRHSTDCRIRRTSRKTRSTTGGVRSAVISVFDSPTGSASGAGKIGGKVHRVIADRHDREAPRPSSAVCSCRSARRSMLSRSFWFCADRSTSTRVRSRFARPRRPVGHLAAAAARSPSPCASPGSKRRIMNSRKVWRPVEPFLAQHLAPLVHQRLVGRGRAEAERRSWRSRFSSSAEIARSALQRLVGARRSASVIS